MKICILPQRPEPGFGYRWNAQAAQAWRPLAGRLYFNAYAYTLAMSPERQISHVVWWQLLDAELPVGKVCHLGIRVPLGFTSAPLEKEDDASLLRFTQHQAPIAAVDNAVMFGRQLPDESLRVLWALVVLLPGNKDPLALKPSPDCWVSDGATHTIFWLLGRPVVRMATHVINAKLVMFAAAVGGQAVDVDHRYPVPGTFNLESGSTISLTWAAERIALATQDSTTQAELLKAV